MVTRHLHYIVEDTERRFYHVVYILDQGDWRFIQEVDEQFLFHRLCTLKVSQKYVLE